MGLSNVRPVDSFVNLKERVERLFSNYKPPLVSKDQLSFEFYKSIVGADVSMNPKAHISEFMDFMSDVMPDGDIYLFGGILRDLALFGKRGFNSDIDVVVEGDWSDLVRYLEGLGAKKNKFGGYRFVVAGWPVDVWKAEETWAIQQGIIRYAGISSLIETTVLNWDAILMNWKTKHFICRDNYLDEINKRILDIVLVRNPNPLGMAVRVFRHLCSKEARKVSARAAKYLADCTCIYSFEDLVRSEKRSYRNTEIEFVVYKFFERIKDLGNSDIRKSFGIAEDIFHKEGISITYDQVEWNFGDILDGD